MARLSVTQLDQGWAYVGFIGDLHYKNGETSWESSWPTGSSQPLGRGSGWRGDLTPCSPPRRSAPGLGSGLGDPGQEDQPEDRV